MRLRPHCLGAAATLVMVATPARAQLTLGASAGTVRYEGGTGNSSLAFSPDFHLDRHTYIAGANATASGTSDGTRVIAAGGSLWAASPEAAPQVLLDGLLQVQGTSPRGDSSSYVVTAFGEVAWAGEGHGAAAGVGAARGEVVGLSSVNALRLGARGWYEIGDAVLAASVEPTRLSGSWFVDFSGRVEYSKPRLDLSAGGKVRQNSGLEGAADASVAYHWTPRLALEVSGGSNLRDPYQGLPRGVFLTISARVLLWTLPSPAGGAAVSGPELSEIALSGRTALATTGHGIWRGSTVPGLTKSGTTPGSSSSGRGHRP